MPRIAWELGVLFVLLLVVFAPNIAQVLSALGPLIPAPQPAFVYPLWAGSANFNLTLVAGQSFVALTSTNYGLSVWTIGGVAGNMSSANYNLQLGAAPLLTTTPAAGVLAWFDNLTVPASPTTYDPAQSYTFSIRWSGLPDEVRLRLTRGGLTLPYYQLSTGEVVQSGDYYTVTIPTLKAGDYTYQWTAYKNASSNQTPEWGYLIRKAVSTLELTVDGEPGDSAVSLGAVVQISALSANTESAVKLMANFSGAMQDINESIGSATYELDTAIVGAGTYQISASVAGDENWTANSSALTLTVASVTLSNAQVVPPSGTAYANRTYTFNATCTGSVSDIFLELDGENLTAGRTGDECRRLVGTLDVGTHSYRWWVSDAAGKWYSTGPTGYVIVKANVALAVLIDGQPRSKLANVTDDPTIGVSMDIDGRRRLVITDPASAVAFDETFDRDETTSFSTQGIALVQGLWNLTATFAGATNYNPARVTRWIAVNMTDSTPVQVTDPSQSTDSPSYGGTVDVGADLSDDVLIDWAWLETNATGEWLNGTPVYIGAPAIRVNFTINATLPPGSTVGWRIWANDTAGRLNSTDTMTFIIAEDTISPTVTQAGQSEDIGNVTDGIIGVGDSIHLSALCSDETMLKEMKLATNQTGTWSNISSGTIPPGLTVFVANFTWQNAAIGEGEDIGWSTAIGWRISCIDYSGNTAASDELIFTVKVFDPADGACTGCIKDGVISDDELNAAITRWKLGLIGITDVLRVVAEWKAGHY